MKIFGLIASMVLACAIAPLLTGCASTVHLDAATVDKAAVDSEKAYTAGVLVWSAEVQAGQVPKAPELQIDAKVYSGIVAARLALDIAHAPSADLIAARTAADAAHASTLSL